jgi:hypothetical protein
MYLSTHQRNRAIAFIVQLYAARDIELTPIYLTSPEYDGVTTPESTGLEICLDEVPVAVDSELTWDQVFECRKDKDAVQKLRRLRRWFTMNLAQKSEREIKATLEEKLDKYQNALRKQWYCNGSFRSHVCIVIHRGTNCTSTMDIEPIGGCSGRGSISIRGRGMDRNQINRKVKYQERRGRLHL